MTDKINMAGGQLPPNSQERFNKLWAASKALLEEDMRRQDIAHKEKHNEAK